MNLKLALIGVSTCQHLLLTALSHAIRVFEGKCQRFTGGTHTHTLLKNSITFVNRCQHSVSTLLTGLGLEWRGFEGKCQCFTG